MELLKILAALFDFIFMDAANGQYLHFLPELLRLMLPGSVLIFDNVLQDVDIVKPNYLVKMKNYTIYKWMRKYLYKLKHNELLKISIVPLGDGITVSAMRGRE